MGVGEVNGTADDNHKIADLFMTLIIVKILPRLVGVYKKYYFGWWVKCIIKKTLLRNIKTLQKNVLFTK